MKWAFSWEAVAVGAGVFVVWVGLHDFYPSFDQLVQSYWCPLVKSVGLGTWCPRGGESDWNPHAQFGANSAPAWFIIATRVLGSSLVVPPLEEVFYRSFLYRWILRADIEAIPLCHFDWRPFVLGSVIFGFAHQQWLAGILCGFAYQGLVCWKKRLGDAITAHAITNFLLALWVISKNAWNFW
jgi:CAAX prenyl protease-like protein